MRRWVVVWAFAAGLAASGATQAATCAPPGGEAAAVQAVRDFFAALHADDEAAYRRSVTDGFYAYDAGKAFHGDELFGQVKSVHAQGRRIDWMVAEPRVEMVCDTALITYVNKSVVGDAKGMQPVDWLESAWLRYQDGRWRLAFLDSQRAAP